MSTERFPCAGGEEEKVYTVSGYRLEDVDGEWMDMEFEEEFDTFKEMKEFVLRHKNDIFLKVDEILDPDGNDIDVLSIEMGWL